MDRVKLSDGVTTIADKATLSGVTTQPAATGTIEFKVYGPFAAQPVADSCTESKLVSWVVLYPARQWSWRVHLARRHGEEGRFLRLGCQLLR